MWLVNPATLVRFSVPCRTLIVVVCVSPTSGSMTCVKLKVTGVSSLIVTALPGTVIVGVLSEGVTKLTGNVTTGGESTNSGGGGGCGRGGGSGRGGGC